MMDHREDVAAGASPRAHHHVCPWWGGYLLASPLRRLVENPERLLEPILRPGLRVLDFGAAMGFFSLPAARLIGESGHLTAMDLQPRMLIELRRRARRGGLAARIDTVECTTEDLGPLPAGATFDVVLLIHVLHEVPDRARTLRQLAGALAPGGSLVFIEPAGHVSEAEFARELAEAGRAGLTVDREIGGRRSRGRVLKKRG